MANLRKIVYLTETQKAELFSQGTVTSNGTTITYNANDLYITPDTAPTLPTVTSSDNGKVLRVVGGVWTAVSLPSASGVNF